MFVVDAAEEKETGVLRDDSSEDHEEAFDSGRLTIEINVEIGDATVVEAFHERDGSPSCRVAVDHHAHEELQHIAD